MRYDATVIIAGAGPAGSLAAYELASRGVDVLMLEKTNFPRYKVCGGGLTYKIGSVIPYDLAPVIEREIFSVRFSHGFSETFIRTSVSPLILCTMRDRLDKFLLGKAGEKGAKVFFNQPVTGIVENADGLEVVTPSGIYHAKILIGADGASSVVAHKAGLRRDIHLGLTWEAEMDADPEDMERYRDTVFLDWGTFPGGYGWIFPKEDHFSVGVGGPVSLSRHLGPYREEFIRSSGIRFSAIRSLKAWPIPVRVKQGLFHAGKVLVVGDAAGLTDPLTGEGIWYAVRSGILAAGSVFRYLEGKEKDFGCYSAQVNHELMPELLEVQRIKAIFNAAPGTIHRLVAKRERVWGAFGKILRGERTYLDVKRGFGRWRFLWGPACWISRVISRYKEIMFTAY